MKNTPRDSEAAIQAIPNRFALVNVVRKRARQLCGGAEPLTWDPADVNHQAFAATAMREIRDGRVTIKEKRHDDPV